MLYCCKKQLNKNAPEKHAEEYREIMQYMGKIFQNEEELMRYKDIIDYYEGNKESDKP